MNNRLIQDEHVCKLARGLLLSLEHELDLRAQGKPFKAREAGSAFEGMCDAVYRLGFGMSATEVHMAVKTVHQSLPMTTGPEANRELRMAEQARRNIILADVLWNMR